MTKERVAIIFFFRFPSLEASYGRPGCGCTVHGVFFSGFLDTWASFQLLLALFFLSVGGDTRRSKGYRCLWRNRCLIMTHVGFKMYIAIWE